jgi:3-hydroxyisobutyrate dehydrogenase-like beta-hydroxyacid dehydrogenase
MQIGFIGLGNMGAAIAANLARARHDVAIWNRSADKARPLVDAGATLAESPRAAAADRGVVFTMLADDAALESVLAGENGLFAGLGSGALHVSMSTIAVATADRIAATHRAQGQHFLCAPVFGRPEAAAAAKLFIVAAGDSADFQMASPLFAVISQRVFYLGNTPSAASLVKLCGNFMILSAIEALGEAMALDHSEYRCRCSACCATTCCKPSRKKAKAWIGPQSRTSSRRMPDSSWSHRACSCATFTQSG